MQPQPRTPRSRRSTIIKALSLTVIAFALVLTATAVYVYYQSVKTFEVRRVSLPTRIFTDAVLFRPGMAVRPPELVEKLERLGYKRSEKLIRAGDFVFTSGEIAIFLRSFRHPTGTHRERPVRLVVTKNTIESVVDYQNGRPVEKAALEPELLTSILSDKLENRSPITLDQVPEHLVNSVIVTEDVRFWKHPGVDPFGITRALFRNVKKGGVAEGGSTLTQQLVKNYYLTNERTMRRKVVEAFMSVILDAKYSKREILEAYLNDIYLGRNRSISILGVGEASRFYFGKPVSEIGISEAALLAGMIRSPNNYSPFTDKEKALVRRNTVLNALLKNRKITPEQHAKALAEKLPGKPSRDRAGLGSIPFYVDRVVHELKNDYGIDDVQAQGLSIYTAIDLDWQAAAAQSVDAGLASLEKSSGRLRRSKDPLQGALIAIDVPSGEIRALVGGRNYDRNQFNRILNAKRQVGSLFKPFVFAAAFEPSLSKQNITPATLVKDTRFVVERKYGKDWSPRNYGEQYYGIVTVRRALEQSMNAASVRLGLLVGLDAIIKTAHVLGVRAELQSVPAMILGAVEVPPIEMAEAYETIARMGSRVPLRAVRYIMDERGRRIKGGVVTPTQVFPARDLYLTTRVMQGVVDRGTAAGARGMGFRKTAAGKTGTTNDKRDAWFIGFTPKTLALTWIGFDDNSPVGVSGSEGAVPMWARFMRQATQFQPDRQFAVPQGITFAPVDVNSGGLATSFCPKKDLVNEAFKSGTEPGTPCSLHQPQIQLPQFTQPLGIPGPGTYDPLGQGEPNIPQPTEGQELGSEPLSGGNLGAPPASAQDPSSGMVDQPLDFEDPRVEPPVSDPPPPPPVPQ